LNEFELIKQFFVRHQRDDVVMGIGDDAAVLRAPPGHELVTTVDTLIRGVHFPEDTSAYDVGYKSLAVNLSDLAAMGAQPAWATLALTLPDNNTDWLEDFSRGMFELAEQHMVSLVGGDTTRGELSISIQCTGFVPEGQAVMRSGARAGDLIFVSGTLGDAWLGLQSYSGEISFSDTDLQSARLRLNRPTPHITLGQSLVSFATAMIDISDGMLADLGHILEASGLAAELDLTRIPLSILARQYLSQGGELMHLLSGGDDFELCFTLPPEHQLQAQTISKQCGCPLTCIGTVQPGSGIVGRSEHETQTLQASGYQHF